MSAKNTDTETRNVLASIMLESLHSAMTSEYSHADLVLKRLEEKGYEITRRITDAELDAMGLPEAETVTAIEDIAMASWSEVIGQAIAQPLPEAAPADAEHDMDELFAYYCAIDLLRGGDPSKADVTEVLGTASPDGPEGNVWSLWMDRQDAKGRKVAYYDDGLPPGPPKGTQVGPKDPPWIPPATVG